MTETGREIVQHQEPQAPAKPKEIMRHVKVIDDVLKKVMKEGTHYGTIPGTGNKPALLKPGAEKICLAFRLTPRLQVTERDLGSSHREYTVKCELLTPNGAVAGEGIGVCSTMEGKYRFRWEPLRAVPSEYWDNRNPALLGDEDHLSTRKVDGKWAVCQRVEHDNPADYYNTCAKMAKKRAHVDATITTTGCSDIFEQGEDDIPAKGAEAAATPRPEPKAASNSGVKATAPQVKLIDGLLKREGIPLEDFLAAHKLTALTDVSFDGVNAALDWIKANAKVQP